MTSIQGLNSKLPFDNLTEIQDIKKSILSQQTEKDILPETQKQDNIQENVPATQAIKTKAMEAGEETGKVTDYAGILKDRLKVSFLNNETQIEELVQNTQKVLEKLIDIVTEEDIKGVLKANYNPQKLSIDMLVKVISHNKVAYKTENIDKLQKEVDEALVKYKELFSDENNLKTAITSLKENNLPSNKKNIEKLIKAANMAEQIKNPSNQTLINILKGDERITLESAYKAKFMGTQAKPVENDLKALEPQIKEILEQAKLTASKSNMELSKMLINENLPLNKESIAKAEQIKTAIKELTAEQVIQKGAENLRNNKSAADILLLENPSKNKDGQVKEIVEDLQKIRTSHIKELVNKELEINLKNLTQEAKTQPADSFQIQAGLKASNKDTGIEQNKQKQTKTVEATKPLEVAELAKATDVDKAVEAVKAAESVKAAERDIKIIKASLQLEEIRLKMTLEAAVKLEEKGIHISTKPLEELVESLKALEREEYTKALDIHNVKIEQASLNKMEDVFERINTIKKMPTALLSDISEGKIEFNIKAISNKAISEILVYRAMKSYDDNQTQIRADLGDRVEKTFVQIDKMLEESNLPITEHNIRVAKIIFKNQMPLETESFESIKLVDLKLLKVTEKLNPGMVAAMLKQEMSPVDMHIDNVIEFMEEYNEKYGITREESIAEAIHSMELDKKLSKEEKESVIGVYRMLSTIERSKGAALGFLLKKGLPLTMNNLFEAAKFLRQNKENAVKADIDDSFGILKQVNYQGKSIKEQINTLAGANSIAEKELVTKAIYKMLENELPITKESLTKMLLAEKQLEEFIEKTAEEGKKGIYTKELTNQESKKEHIEKITEIIKARQPENNEVLPHTVKKLLDSIFEQSSQSSLKPIQVKEDYYQMPVFLGDRIGQINIYYAKDKKHRNHQEAEEMNVYMYFHTENLGRIQTNIKLKKDNIEFSIFTEDKESLKLLESNSEGIKAAIEQSSLKLTKLAFEAFQAKSPNPLDINSIKEKEHKKHKDSKFETII